MRLLIVLLMLASCSDQKTESKEYPQIQKMAWLEGRWAVEMPAKDVMEKQPDEVVEEWVRESDSVLVATSWVHTGKDSVLGERMRLEEKGGRLKFVATVPGQNAGRPVTFKDSNNTATFINAEHDFPQRIRYRPVTRDSAIAEISGNTAKGELTITYVMRRI
ncbi:MAG: hypothetical protein EOO08_07865 [Chitinophagaceae bacterium]|nr:MAG: hypothetical protein EOO08_07865 [Chitinophagaceae bacterium]